MKTLIRHKGETVLETAGIDGIEWNTGAPLTNPSWAGGPYALCEDCPYTDVEPSDFDITEVEIPSPEPLSDGESQSVTTRRIATFNKQKYDERKAQENTE